MSMLYRPSTKRTCMRALSLAALLLPCSFAHAERSIDLSRSADPTGTVEFSELAGSVQFVGWDRSEVQVAGTLGDGIDSVDLSGSSGRTIIHLVLRAGVSNHGGEARLVIHVPVASAIAATTVSADLELHGIRGDAKLQTVSGDVSGDMGGGLHASTVSGSVRLTARETRSIEIKTISGDVHLSGGSGELEITTVSGTVSVDRGSLTRGRFKSVSGTVSVQLALASDADLSAESVNGDVSFNFSAPPAAEFDVQSFSGDIENCFGPAPEKSRYGSGSRLMFKNGDARARVRIDTKSGDVKLCGKDLGK
jgi:hypothetical protein